MNNIEMRNVQKRQVVEALLAWCPFMSVDIRDMGLKLPEFLMKPDLVLRVGRDPQVMGMPDLVLDEKGWSATISIKGVRHFIVVPWSAVVQIWVPDGAAIVFPTLEAVAEPEPKKPGLRLVKDGAN